MSKTPLYQVVTTTAGLHAAPEACSEMVSEALFGEALEALKEKSSAEGWIRARTQRDAYEGYVLKENLAPQTHAPTHQVGALSSLLYASPDYKKPPVMALPFLAQLSLKDEPPQNGFLPLAQGDWVWAGHVEPISLTRTDYVETALRFLGTPYLWGGRSARGLDCSGLVQLALLAAGIPCPRDTKDQIALGSPADENSPLARGDLVFFERHVGIMIDEENILNATARSMDTRVENLAEMTAYYKGGILAHRKITK